MMRRPARATRMLVFLGVALPSFGVGLVLARGIERTLASNPSAAFIALFALALAILALGHAVERPLLWGRLLDSTPRETRWIGSSRGRLRGSPPPPIALGIAAALLVTALA